VKTLTGLEVLSDWVAHKRHVSSHLEVYFDWSRISLHKFHIGLVAIHIILLGSALQTTPKFPLYSRSSLNFIWKMANHKFHYRAGYLHHLPTNKEKQLFPGLLMKFSSDQRYTFYSKIILTFK
jgi:hypothetical protein